MRLPPIYIARCYAALSILIGCGGVVRQDSDGKGGVPVEAGDASMNPGGSGAANAGGSAGSMGNRAGARGAARRVVGGFHNAAIDGGRIRVSVA